MLWAGLLALPVAILPVLFFQEIYNEQAVTYQEIFVRLLGIFSLGAIAASAYEVLLQKHFVTVEGSRKELLWLLVGPLVLVMGLVMGQNLVVALALALIADLIILLVIRSDLFWDAAFSGIAVGLLYVVVYLINFRLLSGEPSQLIVMAPLGALTVMGLPVVEIILIALFGSLWGPLYVALKSLRPD